MNESREFRVYPDMVGRLARRGTAMIADNAVVVGDSGRFLLVRLTVQDLDGECTLGGSYRALRTVSP